MSNLPIDYVRACAARRRRKALIAKLAKYEKLVILLILFIFLLFFMKITHINRPIQKVSAKTLPVATSHSKRGEEQKAAGSQDELAQPIDSVALIEKIWGVDAPTGIAIAKCESGLNSNAVNYNTNNTVDFGLFQVNSIHGNYLDPVANVTYAYQLYQAQGTTPWNSSKSCWGN